MPWWGWMLIGFIVLGIISDVVSVHFYRKMRGSFDKMNKGINEQLDIMNKGLKMLNHTLEEQQKVANKIAQINGVIRTLTAKKG